jgi:antitoxin (DNA-binding transcriptional repressor) of toxin-antitoxin stability system
MEGAVFVEISNAETIMKISLTTLSKRQEDVLSALKRNEKISISHNGQMVAVLQPPGTGSKRERKLDTPAFGMWADRDDMVDPNEWRRSLRKKRRDNLSRRTEGGGA